MLSDRQKFVARVVFSIILAVFDFASDCFNLPTYWGSGAVSIFYASLVFVILPLPLAIAQIILGVWQTKYGNKEDFIEKLEILNILETLMESIPQLIISVIFMSICGNKLGIAQYISVIMSCVAIAERMFTMEIDTTVKTFVMCSKYVVLFTCKVLYVTARILAISYFCFFLGPWILFIFAVRWIIWAVANCCIHNGWREYVFSVFLHTLAFGYWPEGVLSLVLPLFTASENLVMAVAAYGESHSSANHTYTGVEVIGVGKNVTTSTYEILFGSKIEEVEPGFCLYDYPIAIHGALNLTSAALIIVCYFLRYNRKESPFEDEELRPVVNTRE